MNYNSMLKIENNAQTTGEMLLKILEECQNHSDQVAVMALEAFMTCGKPGEVHIGNCTFTNRAQDEEVEDESN